MEEPRVSLVFLGGVHGAGKGELATELASDLALNHLSAGQLIRGRHGSEGRTKKVEDVDCNQRILLSALEIERRGEGPILLDGHFAVLDRSGLPEAVALSVFLAIKPASLILLTIDPGEAYLRLIHRDGQAPNPSQLAALQAAELHSGCTVARAAGIPLLVLASPQLELASAFISTTLRLH